MQIKKDTMEVNNRGLLFPMRQCFYAREEEREIRRSSSVTITCTAARAYSRADPSRNDWQLHGSGSSLLSLLLFLLLLLLIIMQTI